MQSLAPVVEPLPVQHRVHFRSPRQFGRPALGPGVAKGFRGLTPAEETRAVPCGERDRLVQEEQLGPTAATHDRAPPSLEFTEADEPGLARPASSQQGPDRRVMNDPAVARKYPSLRQDGSPNLLVQRRVCAVEPPFIGRGTFGN